MSDYQLIVIGAGPGGYEAAIHAAKLGLKTAVVENRHAGGTCLNRGCIPTKTLLHSSEVYSTLTSGKAHGVKVDNLSIDTASIFAYKDEVVEKLRGGIETLFKQGKIDYLRGTGTIIGEHTVKVTGEEGEQTYTADDIMIATGSVPALPPIPGLTLDKVYTSDDLLEGKVPEFNSMVIIGGGVIGVEFATFYNDLGREVTIVEGLDRLLPILDKEIGQNLNMILKKKGVTTYTGAMVSQIVENGDQLTVQFTAKEKEEAVSADIVLCAIGRRPNTNGLFEEGGFAVEMERGRILVDENYQTNVPHIYAIGDVSSKIQLAHVATAQGIACVHHIAGHEGGVNCNVIPSCIYVRPEIASVGMSEAEAKAAGIDVKVGKVTLFGNGKTVIAQSERSFMKVVAEAETGRILGAQFMCEHATDMISQITTAIVNNMTVADLKKAMRPHPTFEEAFGEALNNF